MYGVGLKLGGVLCQSAYRGGRFQVVVGVGLNLANRAPTTCVDALIDARHRQLGLPGAPQPVQREVRWTGFCNGCWTVTSLGLCRALRMHMHGECMHAHKQGASLRESAKPAPLTAVR